MKKPSVFISYNHKSTQVMMRVIEKIDPIANVYCDIRLGPWESFKNFMDKIAKQDFVVVIISDDYLKSLNCQYEVLQLMKNEKWKNKTMFIVEDSRIYDVKKRAEYTDYWASQKLTFQKELIKHDAAAVNELVVEMNNCENIRRHIGEFLMTVADANNPGIDDAIDEIARRMKISAKRNTCNELEKEIIKLITNGINTIVDICVSTNRAERTINGYMSRLVKEGKLVRYGVGRNRNYRITAETKEK